MIDDGASCTLGKKQTCIVLIFDYVGDFGIKLKKDKLKQNPYFLFWSPQTEIILRRSCRCLIETFFFALGRYQMLFVLFNNNCGCTFLKSIKIFSLIECDVLIERVNF